MRQDLNPRWGIQVTVSVGAERVLSGLASRAPRAAPGACEGAAPAGAGRSRTSGVSSEAGRRPLVARPRPDAAGARPTRAAPRSPRVSPLARGAAGGSSAFPGSKPRAPRPPSACLRFLLGEDGPGAAAARLRPRVQGPRLPAPLWGAAGPRSPLRPSAARPGLPRPSPLIRVGRKAPPRGQRLRLLRAGGALFPFLQGPGKQFTFPEPVRVLLVQRG